jgi:hypothetical protein
MLSDESAMKLIIHEVRYLEERFLNSEVFEKAIVIFDNFSWPTGKKNPKSLRCQRGDKIGSALQ